MRPQPNALARPKPCPKGVEKEGRIVDGERGLKVESRKAHRPRSTFPAENAPTIAVDLQEGVRLASVVLCHGQAKTGPVSLPGEPSGPDLLRHSLAELGTFLTHVAARRPCYGLFSKPHPDGTELDEGKIARGQLVVTCCNPPVLFETADQALRDVALAIERRVHEPERPLRLELRDNGADPATPEIVSRRLTRVAPVIYDRSRPQLRPART